MPNPTLLSLLARAFLAGEQTREAIIHRATHALGKKYAWLGQVADAYLRDCAGGTHPRHSHVQAFLKQDATLSEHLSKLKIAAWLSEPQRMQPVKAAKDWNLPPIETTGALADWLSLSTQDLSWFADLKELTRGRECIQALRHYRYRVVEKKSGGIRLIESPKPRLKALQRCILTSMLNQIPLHSCVHGFRAGHSIKTFAAPHTGQGALLRMDLRDFFPSFSGPRIQTFFRTAGYPEPVADLLGGLCTNAAPSELFAHCGHESIALYARSHLPQGAPTSPTLANLCAYRLDCRLAGLARSSGAAYTRYADDLAFSGAASFSRHIDNFAAHVAAIAQEEGFAVQHHKTRIMRPGVSQHLAGLIVNQHLNIPRADFDTLKATLTNCARHGPNSQNHAGLRDFQAHLQGRVAFVEMINPRKGIRLRTILNRINWRQP